MKAIIQIKGKDYVVDLSKGVSISTPFYGENHLPRAFYSPRLNIEAVRNDGWVGSTAEGGILNFKNIFINPHGCGTHTECLGHISKEPYHIKDTLKSSHHLAQLLTLTPEKKGEDTFISKQQIIASALENEVNCLIIRTKPNKHSDKIKDWSGTNPTYIHADALTHLVEMGIEHFMIDVPSVDRENDEGKLLAHKAFWKYPGEQARLNATITEMIYAPDEVEDGIYLVDIQLIPFVMDASPSNIVLYKVKHMES